MAKFNLLYIVFNFIVNLLLLKNLCCLIGKNGQPGCENIGNLKTNNRVIGRDEEKRRRQKKRGEKRKKGE
jgi:hypothetical protein